MAFEVSGVSSFQPQSSVFVVETSWTEVPSFSARDSLVHTFTSLISGITTCAGRRSRGGA
jgi:hypothetical protein